MARAKDNDPRTTEELKTEAFSLMKDYLVHLFDGIGDTSVSMTAATEAIWGTSGRGNPGAVRIIETLSRYGFVEITGRKRRRVCFSSKGREFLSS